jgi:hypothetical protein
MACFRLGMTLRFRGFTRTFRGTWQEDNGVGHLDLRMDLAIFADVEVDDLDCQFI